MSSKMTPVEEAAMLRLATREAHEAMSDMRTLVRELRKATEEGKVVVDQIDKAANVAVDERVAGVIQKGLDEYGDTIKNAIESATQAVFDRFDTIMAVILGEDEATKRRGEPSVPEMLEKRFGRRA